MLGELHEHLAVLRLTAGEKRPISGERHQKGAYVKPSLEQWLAHEGNYGALAGERSGDLEVLDFDLKNTTNDDFMAEYKQLILEQLGGEFIKSLVVQQTPSGGFHFLYRAKNIEGNLKLAKNSGGREAIIETRGEGGYIAIAPSANYKFIQGSPKSIPYISDEERNILIDSARAMGEHKEVEPRRKPPTGLASGNDTDYFERYNREASMSDVLAMLESNGWKESSRTGSKIRLKRIGSDNPWGADLDTPTGIPIFWVWSTSTDFNDDEPYTPIAVRNLLYDHGDWKDTYQYLKSLYDVSVSSHVESLINPLKERINTPSDTQVSTEVIEAPDADLFSYLEDFRVTDRTVVEDEPVIIKIKGIPITSAGNVSAISGRVKAGKSAVVNAIISKAIDPEAIGFDMIEVMPSGGKAIIHIDTEQSTGKQKQNLEWWILNRTSLSHSPDNYYSYNFKSFSVREAREYLVAILEGTHKKHGGVHLVMIDGLSEFVKTVNDEEGSVTVIKMLMELSAIYKCAFVVNIHTNPNAEFVKQRGHLGSELQRKVESMLYITREQKDTFSTLTANFLRNGDPTQFGEIHIGYNQEQRMHEVVSVDDYADNYEEVYKQQANMVAGETMDSAIRKIHKNQNIKIPAAKRIINELLAADYLFENEEGILISKSHIYET